MDKAKLETFRQNMRDLEALVARRVNGGEALGSVMAPDHPTGHDVQTRDGVTRVRVELRPLPDDRRTGAIGAGAYGRVIATTADDPSEPSPSWDIGALACYS